jgi:hypothetical protein
MAGVSWVSHSSCMLQLCVQDQQLRPAVGRMLGRIDRSIMDGWRVLRLQPARFALLST